MKGDDGMGMKVEIPKDERKLKRQIEALEWLLAHDQDELSKEIHGKALEDSRKALRALEKRN